MKKQLLLFAAFLPGFLVNAQTNRTDLEINNLKGKIKSAIELTYKGVMKAGKIEKAVLTDREYMEFNKAGYKTQYEKENIAKNWGITVKKYRYENDTRMVEYTEESKDIFRITQIKYNSQGKIETVEYVDNNGNLEHRQKYKYDANGLLMQIDTYKGDGTYSTKTGFTYNSKKQLVKKLRSNAKGEPTWEETFSYDENGNRAEETSLDRSVATATPDSRKYKYNEKKQKIEESYTQSGSKTDDLLLDFGQNETFEYNEHGDMVRSSALLTVTISYTYDQHNNWIKAVKTTGGIWGSEASYEVVERQIAYY